MAQRYFDQGLRLTYAFNHAEALRAFREAQRLDPDCAMCYWGEAFVLGPNINAPMDGRRRRARPWSRSRKAQARAGQGEPQGAGADRRAGQALRRRAGAERAALDAAYADAMAASPRASRTISEIAVLSAEAMMDTSPWDYWEADGRDAEGPDRRGDRRARGGAEGQPRPSRRDPPLHPPDRGLRPRPSGPSPTPTAWRR